MISYIVDLISAWLPIWSKYLVQIFALGIVATVPCMIRTAFLRR